MAQNSAAHLRASSARRWLLLVVLAAGLFLITLDNSILYTALPTLTRELGASGSESLWIINAYPLVVAGLLLGAGTLGDRVGHRRMFLGGLLVFAAASLTAAFAPSAAFLIAARGFLAVGAAMMMPATLALIRITFHDIRQRNVAIAIWGSVATIGASLGPVIGGLLLEWFWWGSVFLINVPVVLIAFVMAYRLAPASDPNRAAAWDLVSSLQVMVALVGLVLFIKEATNPARSWWLVGAAALAALVAGWMFVRRQDRLAEPLLDFSIFKNPAFRSGVLAAGLAMFAVGGVQLVITQHFQLVQGLTPLQSGALVAALAIGSLPTSLAAGALLHRTGLQIPVGYGLAASALAIGLSVWAVQHGTIATVLALLVLGLCLGPVMGVASSAIVGNAPARRAGMASSVEEVSYEFGAMTAVALLGSLLNAVYTVRLDVAESQVATDSLASTLATAGGDQNIIQLAQAAFTDGLLVVLTVAGAVMAVGAGLALIWLRRHRPGTATSLGEPVADKPATKTQGR